MIYDLSSALLFTHFLTYCHAKTLTGKEIFTWGVKSLGVILIWNKEVKKTFLDWGPIWVNPWKIGTVDFFFFCRKISQAPLQKKNPFFFFCLDLL